MCYWRVQRGSKQFVTQLVKTLLNIYPDSIQNQEISINTIIQGVLVLGQLTKKEDTSELAQSLELKKFFEDVENYLQKQIDFLMMTYRGSKQLFKLMMNKILTLKMITLNYIIKKLREKRLKEVREITPEEIFEISFSYLITRVATREFYKLLEIVITFRFEDLQKNAILLSKLHDLYLKSGLCDTKLIERMAAVL